MAYTPRRGATVSPVTELVSMLVPLDGFATTQPPWLDILGLLIGVPAIIFILIAVLTKSKGLIRAARGEHAADPQEPIWIGAAPLESGTVTSTEPAPVPVPAADEVGGASVRW